MEPYVEPWRPGIGDPTVMGWLTVVAYFGAAFACGLAHRRGGGRGHRWVWPSLCVLLVLLGFNKQLDLQSWFTYVGKKTAVEQGWYAERRPMQVGFIVVLATVGLATGVVLFRRLRGALGRFRLTLMGTVFLMAFVVIRAASFHHVDLFLKVEIGGVQPNWVLELGGIVLIALGALRDAGALQDLRRRSARALRKLRPRRKRAEEMGWIDIVLELWERGEARQRRTPSPRSKTDRRGEHLGRSPGNGRRAGSRVVMTGPPRRH
jgi:hypothetical protein